MRLAIIALIIIGLSYYVANYPTPFHLQESDPYYVQVRMDFHQSDVQLVGVSKMNSYEECKTQAVKIWAKSFETLGRVKVDLTCKTELPAKYKKLFDNKKTTASYVVFDKGSDEERDARFLIYGVPSSYVYDKCEEITKEVKKTYTGKVYCVQGTVG